MKTYFVTWAQNATPVHPKFWASVQSLLEHRGAELVVIPGRYRNPTSTWSKQQETDEWWAPEVTPSLAGRKKICPKLVAYGDISIQPTANHPLTGFEGFLGANCGIFGHPKRAMQVVPTATRSPRVMWTTGACTVRNYTKSKAGKKGEHHHVLGGLIVEVDPDGCFFVRRVTAVGRTGAFQDLDTLYTPEGAFEGPPAATLTLGDLHAGREEEDVLQATERLHELVRPRAVVLHDVLDFYSRNPHERASRRARFDTRFESVEAEVKGAAAAVDRIAHWGDGSHETVVVRSNHDEMLERWANSHDDLEDPHNAPYHHELLARSFRHRLKRGEFPDLFPMEARRVMRSRRVRFLRSNERYRRAGVDHGFHGHRGPGGSRGSMRGMAKLGVKLTKGHHHAPGEEDGVVAVGVSSQLDHGYNHLPSSWLHAQCVLYADGKRTLVVIVKGRFRGGET